MNIMFRRSFNEYEKDLQLTIFAGTATGNRSYKHDYVYC